MASTVPKRLLTGGKFGVAIDQVAVVGNVIGEQSTQTFHVITPITMQFACNAKPGHQLSARRGHTVPCRMARQFVERAGSIRHHKYIKAFFQSRQGRKGHAHFGDYAGDNQLLLAGRFDGFNEVFVIPGIDLARACNVGGIGEKFLSALGPEDH